MTSPVVGLGIALAAILVQAPRLVLALLAADRRPVAPAWEGTLLVVAGIGTALVLTGGNLYGGARPRQCLPPGLPLLTTSRIDFIVQSTLHSLPDAEALMTVSPMTQPNALLPMPMSLATLVLAASDV